MGNVECGGMKWNKNKKVTKNTKTRDYVILNFILFLIYIIYIYMWLIKQKHTLIYINTPNIIEKHWTQENWEVSNMRKRVRDS